AGPDLAGEAVAVPAARLQGDVVAEGGLDEDVGPGADVLGDQEQAEPARGGEALDLVAVGEAAGGGGLPVLLQPPRGDRAHGRPLTVNSLQLSSSRRLRRAMRTPRGQPAWNFRRTAPPRTMRVPSARG